MPDRPHRDFLAIPDFSREELERLFELADTMRRGATRRSRSPGNRWR